MISLTVTLAGVEIRVTVDQQVVMLIATTLMTLR